MPILRPPAACGSSQESELVFREFLRKRFEEKKQKQWKGPTNRPANGIHSSLSIFYYFFKIIAHSGFIKLQLQLRKLSWYTNRWQPKRSREAPWPPFLVLV